MTKRLWSFIKNLIEIRKSEYNVDRLMKLYWWAVVLSIRNLIKIGLLCCVIYWWALYVLRIKLWNLAVAFDRFISFDISIENLEGAVKLFLWNKQMQSWSVNIIYELLGGLGTPSTSPPSATEQTNGEIHTPRKMIERKNRIDRNYQKMDWAHEELWAWEVGCGVVADSISLIYLNTLYKLMLNF
jgi:hypothetical protein